MSSSNPIDQLKGVNNEPSIITEPTTIASVANEVVSHKPVFAGQVGIDPSLSQMSPASFPNIEPQLQSSPSFPSVEPARSRYVAAPPTPLERTPVLQGAAAPALPSGLAVEARLQAPTFAAATANAQFQVRAQQSAIDTPQQQEATWAAPNLEQSNANFGANAEVLRESFKRQTAERVSDNQQPNPSESAISALRNPDTVIDLPGVLVWMPLVAIVFLGFWSVKRRNRPN